MNILEKNINQITLLCDKHKVLSLYLFGSVLTDKFNPDSDIDILVEFGNVKLYDYFDNYMDFKEGIENVLDRKVDLLENKTVKNPYLRQSIDRNKKLIYGRESTQVAI